VNYPFKKVRTNSIFLTHTPIFSLQKIDPLESYGL